MHTNIDIQMKELRFRNNLECSTNVFKDQYTFSYLRYSIELYRVDSQGELAIEALRSVVKKVNEVSSFLKRIKTIMEKEVKEWMDMFMMEKWKEIKEDWIWTNN